MRGEPGNKAIANRPCLLTVYLHWLLYKPPELQVRVKFSVVTEVSTFFVLTQVGSGKKKSYNLIFSKCKYLHAKIGNLGTVN